jgi:acetolactate synthase-1/2/3 large subunit
VEGDGGFAQNLQELATVDVQQLNLKIFIFANEGYASIRMTQRNYFDGGYLGCDTSTGLGFPDWEKLALAYGLSFLTLSSAWADNPQFIDAWNSQRPTLFIVLIHPEQTYFPKISSQVTPSGGMMSAPLHLMTPEIT